MRLQIKKLDGPREIRLTSNAQTSYPTTVGANDAVDRFTCYFNRAITNEDPFPQTVTVKVYNGNGVEQVTIPLSVDRNIVNQENTVNANFCFTLILNCPETMSGSHFYVHTVLLNTDANAQNVSYGVSSYHQTIKKVYIYAEKQFLQVYWSNNEQITYDEQQATQESPRSGNIGQNEDAFLHIKTRGMYEDQTVLLLSADDGAVELRRETLSMRQNRRVVAFDMAETIQRYRQQTDQMTGNVSFTLKATLTIPNPNAGNAVATVSPTGISDQTATSERGWGEAILVVLAQIITAPLWLLSGCTSNNRDPETATARTSTQVNANNIIQSSTEQLTVTCTDITPATKRTSTGTVYVNVNTGETPDIIPTKFTDFRVGRICYLEGIGRIERKYSNITTVRLTVYPFRVYDIMLSDLIVSGAITIDDAIIIAPPTEQHTDEAKQRKRNQLEQNFNKLTTRIANNEEGQSRVLLDVFGEAERFGSNNVYKLNRNELVRKILSVSKVRTPIFEREISRDAWQAENREREGRYNFAKECPPGEYFINYKSGGKYRVMVSQYASPAYIANQVDAISCIEDYPHGVGETHPRRGSIALHKGGSQASIGCITFNVQYSREDNNYTEFNNIMYLTKNNTRYLNFICIDERNAVQNINLDHRYYDLIKPPGARGHNSGTEYETPGELATSEVNEVNDPEFEG